MVSYFLFRLKLFVKHLGTLFIYRDFLHFFSKNKIFKQKINYLYTINN